MEEPSPRICPRRAGARCSRCWASRPAWASRRSAVRSRAAAPDGEGGTGAILSAVVVPAWPGAPGRVLVIAIAGLIGWRLLTGSSGEKRVSLPPVIRRRTAVASLVVFLALLGALPLLRQVVTSPAFVVFDSFFRVGSVVFGGGHG